jgi:hypothetical protein
MRKLILSVLVFGGYALAQNSMTLRDRQSGTASSSLTIGVGNTLSGSKQFLFPGLDAQLAPIDTVLYDFTPITPTGTLTAGASCTTTLPHVPPGVNHTDIYHGLWVTDGTNSENLIISGGTAIAGGTAQTLIFANCVHTYTSGAFTLQSNTGGGQEAYQANIASGGQIRYPASPGIAFHGTLFIHASGFDVTAPGAVFFPQVPNVSLFVFDGVSSPISASIHDVNIYDTLTSTTGGPHIVFGNVAGASAYNIFSANGYGAVLLNGGTIIRLSHLYLGNEYNYSVSVQGNAQFVDADNVLSSSAYGTATTTGIQLIEGSAISLKTVRVSGGKYGLTANPGTGQTVLAVTLTDTEFDSTTSHGVLLQPATGVVNNFKASNTWVSYCGRYPSVSASDGILMDGSDGDIIDATFDGGTVIRNGRNGIDAYGTGIFNLRVTNMDVGLNGVNGNSLDAGIALQTNLINGTHIYNNRIGEPVNGLTHITAGTVQEPMGIFVVGTTDYLDIHDNTLVGDVVPDYYASTGTHNTIYNNNGMTTDTAGTLYSPLIVSNGGFFSNYPSGSWQAFNSNTDGALLRGYGVGATVANTSGGYFDFAPVQYSPSPGYTCYDKYGNTSLIPVPLNGLSSGNWQPGGSGQYNSVLWNSTSPMQGYHAPFTTVGSTTYWTTGTPCTAPLPIMPNEPTGLNVNTYVFARGGFATDNRAWDSAQFFSGGMQAGTFTAATLYAPGTPLRSGFAPNAVTKGPQGEAITIDGSGNLSNKYGAWLGGYIYTGYSDQNPSVGTIAGVDNPIVPNFAVPGSTLTEISAWSSILTYPVGATVLYNGAYYLSKVNPNLNNNPATSPTDWGVFNVIFPGMISFNTALNCEVVSDNSLAFGCIGGNLWTLSGSLVYPVNTSYNLLVGETTEVSGAKMEVNGNFGANGTIQSYVSGGTTQIAFQTANGSGNNFQVNYNGLLSLASEIHINNSGTGSVYLGASEWQPQTTGIVSLGDSTHMFNSGYFENMTVSGTCTGCGGGSGYWTLSGSLIYPSNTSYSLLVGETTEVSGAKMEVNGNFEANGAIQSYVSGGTTQIAFQTATGSSNAFSVNYNGYVSAVNEHLTGTAFFGQTGTPSDDGTASYLQVQAPNGAVFSGTVSDTFFTGVSGNTGPNALVTHTGGTLPAGEYVVELYVTANGLSGSIATVVHWYDVRNYVSYTATLLATGGQGWSFPIRVDGIHDPNISTTLTGTVIAYDYSVALVKVM